MARAPRRFDLAWFSTASVLTKEAIGSTFYCAPEQIYKPRSLSARDFRVDQYAFGQLLFFGLTGSDPLQNASDNANELRSRLQNWSLATLQKPRCRYTGERQHRDKETAIQAYARSVMNFTE